MIKAPYNFAPLNKKVFYPSWAKDISHDIPFRDGQSGELELSITAHSPIFIANSKKDREEKETKFCNIGGKFFIPATSIKGTIRSVLEIISFSKLRDFDDSTYAVRDFSKGENFYMEQMRKPTYCGWLYKKDGDFFIQDCGIPGRISQKEIDKIYNMEFSKEFRDGYFENKNKNKELKTAKYKYEDSLLKGKNLENKFRYLKKSYSRDIYIQDNSGKAGTIVFTGQPGARKEAKDGKKASGKIYEFIFFDEIKQEFLVSQKMMEDFKFAYFDDRKTEPKESIDWGYWKEKLKNAGKVPVFFQLDDKGELLHFGLAYMYKIIYKHSISAGILQNTKSSLDLTQAIFGYTDKDTKEALKGRVYFSHFLALGSPKELDSRGEILGTPRASYYPNYIKQSGGELKSYMDDRFEIAGRKRYPVHKGGEVSTTKEKESSENVKSFFAPLDKGTKFSGKVKFHNLKKAEIGALISAITFHNTKNTFYNLGFAKPYGYGKCTIEITNLSQDEIKEYLAAFEKEILKQIPYWGDLEKNDSLKELLAMAMEQESKGDFALKYMDIGEFSKAKTKREYLKSYSSLVNFDDSCFKLSLSKEELENLEKNKAIIQKWQSIQNTQDINILKNFIQNYPDSDFTKEAKEKLEQINTQIKQQKEQEEDKKAWDNWHSITKSKQNRYYKEMIEKHIKTYPDHDSVDEAKKELERLSLESKVEPSDSANAMDIIKLPSLDEITMLLKKLDKSKINIDDDNRAKIASHIENLAKDASKKRVRTFRRKAELQKIFKESQIDEIFKKFE
ncbi:TIGR03986 family CRISPR-associated RAMP protein [Campylobacter ureolyticus]|uniref:TIGR03986 family type III CRISPR-associated RAMP protein n=1 Tax=Campylobacter ureolyticus TaxID=827 RepID=UPI0022B4DEA5|nr:TIGR03986 family CRISPR-associated RAMP protein [Campylobacter ureolyticus]MCZ6158090.1 TIGR03986 family CRISPR-associated RAMP protein [Campylobacter ureolyticus]